MTIAIVGATGLVGRTMLTVLQERNVRYTSLILLASKRSAGHRVRVGSEEHIVQELTDDCFRGVDVALFSAGGVISKRYAPIAAAEGCIVIDNSSAWRMDEHVPLVVPEVNAADVYEHNNIIANPNCSTIQMVVALKPLHDQYGLRRVVVSTYQSVSGAGQKGADQLMAEIDGKEPQERISPHQLAFNTVFHNVVDQSGADGVSTEEEAKMVRETRRIMHMPELPIAVTCVRIPVLGAHSESIAVEFERELPSLADIRTLLSSSPGITVVDNPVEHQFPTPLLAQGTDDVYVGRLRRDPTTDNGLLMWVVSDNLRKGAATNAVQILELLRREAENVAAEEVSNG